MPTYPANLLCSHLGCKEHRSQLSGLCTKHGGKNYVINEDDKVYRTAQWRSVRARQISTQPLCQSCLVRGVVTQGNQVDHVFPHRRIGRESFTHNLFQTLCQPCHSYKTGQEKQGRFECYRGGTVQVYGENDYSIVLNGL